MSGKSSLAATTGRDAAAVRELERSVLRVQALARGGLLPQGGAAAGGAAAAAVAQVKKVEEQLRSVQRQAGQQAQQQARAAQPAAVQRVAQEQQRAAAAAPAARPAPVTPVRAQERQRQATVGTAARATAFAQPTPSLVARPDLGQGVFGGAPGTAPVTAGEALRAQEAQRRASLPPAPTRQRQTEPDLLQAGVDRMNREAAAAGAARAARVERKEAAVGMGAEAQRQALTFAPPTQPAPQAQREAEARQQQALLFAPPTGVAGSAAGAAQGTGAVQETRRAQEGLNAARAKGLPAAEKAAALARQEAQALAQATGAVAGKPKNAWQVEQDRLADRARVDRGYSSQGPQVPPGADVARAGGGLGTTAALAAGVAAGASAAAAGGRLPGSGIPRQELREAARAASRGIAGQFALPQTGDKQLIALPQTISQDAMRLSLEAQATKARTAAEVAKRQRDFLTSPAVNPADVGPLPQGASTAVIPPGKESVQAVLLAQAMQRQREAELRVQVSKIPKGPEVIAAESAAYKDELRGGETEKLKLTESQRRDAKIRAERLQFTPTGMPREGVDAALRQQGQEFGLQGDLAEERRAQALALRTGTGRSAADRARSDQFGLGGTADREAAFKTAGAVSAETYNQQLRQTVGAQATAAFMGTKEGADELKKTAALRLAEARAMKQIDWRRSVGELGTVGASLKKVGEGAKAVGDYAGFWAAVKAAQIIGLGAIASSSHFGTLQGSGEMLGASFGRDLLPAMDTLSGAMQSAAKAWDSVPDWVHKMFGGGAAATLGGLAAVYTGAKVVQGGAWAYGGIAGAARWLGSAKAPSAGDYFGSMGPGGGAVTGAGAGVQGTFLGISSAGAATIGSIAALGAAALAGEYALLKWSQNQDREAVEGANKIPDYLTRKEVVESPGYKKVEAAPPDQRRAVAEKELAEANARYQKATKEYTEEMPNIAYNAVDRSLGNAARWATGSAGDASINEKKDAMLRERKNVEEAMKTYQEFVPDKTGKTTRFEGGKETGGGKAQEGLLRALRGLPNPQMFNTGMDAATNLLLKGLVPEGDLDRQNRANQLIILAQTKQVLEQIRDKLGEPAPVPRGVDLNVNQRP